MSSCERGEFRTNLYNVIQQLSLSLFCIRKVDEIEFSEKIMEHIINRRAVVVLRLKAEVIYGLPLKD